MKLNTKFVCMLVGLLLLATTGCNGGQSKTKTDLIIKLVRNGDKQGLQAQIDKGVDLNSFGSEGYGLLHVAAISGSEEMVNFLIANGAEVSLKDHRSESSPIVFEIQNQDYDMVVQFLDHGADVRAVDWGGCEPIHMAANIGTPQIIQELFDRGADINARNNLGESPLFSASFGFAEIECLEALLILGADTSITNNKGETVLDARNTGTAEKAKLIQQYMK